MLLSVCPPTRSSAVPTLRQTQRVLWPPPPNGMAIVPSQPTANSGVGGSQRDLVVLLPPLCHHLGSTKSLSACRFPCMHEGFLITAKMNLNHIAGRELLRRGGCHKRNVATRFLACYAKRRHTDAAFCSRGPGLCLGSLRAFTRQKINNRVLFNC